MVSFSIEILFMIWVRILALNTKDNQDKNILLQFGWFWNNISYMKKVVKKKSVPTIPMWVVVVSIMMLGFLIYGVTKSRDSRSSANDDVEAGVVLPVASDKE